MHAPAQLEGRLVQLEVRHESLAEQFKTEQQARKTSEEKVSDRIGRIEKILYVGFGALGGWQLILKLMH